jgi:ATP-dependent DNA helicase RecG
MEGSENRIITENWDRAKRFGKIDPDNFNPFSKNPILARFFVKIGRADELGSGVKNLYKFTKIYSGGEPELEEGDVFKTTVPLSVFATSRVTEVSEKVTEVSEKVTEVAEPPGRLAEQSVRVAKN